MRGSRAYPNAEQLTNAKQTSPFTRYFGGVWGRIANDGGERLLSKNLDRMINNFCNRCSIDVRGI